MKKNSEPLFKRVSYVTFEYLTMGEVYPTRHVLDYFNALQKENRNKVTFKFSEDSHRLATVPIDNLRTQVVENLGRKTKYLGWKRTDNDTLRLITED